jgi:hypothetical protein
MSRLIHATPVERLVEAYLKRLRNTNKVRKEQNIITKAAKMIGIALHDPCCPPAEEVILGTQENFFTIQLRALLNGIDARKHRESLERAKLALENALEDPCCLAVCPSPYPEVVDLPDAEEGSPYFTTIQLQGTGVFQIQVQQIPDGLTATVDPDTGIVTIQGTPTVFGNFVVQFKAANCNYDLPFANGPQYPIVISELFDFVARTPANGNNWYDVAWGNDLFVAIAQSGTGDRVMTSPDGISWTIRTSASDSTWNSITWSETLGLFVAVAQTGIMTSPDGITWTSRTEPEAGQWREVIWVDELSLFVAVGTLGSNRVMTSPDGITWTSRTASALNQWYGVAWSPELSLLVAVGISGVGTRVMTSPDGINWTTRTSASDQQWRKVVWSSTLNLFVAVATTAPAFTNNNVMTSPDGINWTLRNSFSNAAWDDIAEVDGFLVAVAAGGLGLHVMKSTDGITWTGVPSPNQQYTGVIYNGTDKFVAVGFGVVASADYTN